MKTRLVNEKGSRPRVVDGVSSRCRMDMMSAGELAILNTVAAVELMGADPRLTDAVVLLGQARGRVADYIEDVVSDEQPNQEPRSGKLQEFDDNRAYLRTGVALLIGATSSRTTAGCYMVADEFLDTLERDLKKCG